MSSEFLANCTHPATILIIISVCLIYTKRNPTCIDHCPYLKGKIRRHHHSVVTSWYHCLINTVELIQVDQSRCYCCKECDRYESESFKKWTIGILARWKHIRRIRFFLYCIQLLCRSLDSQAPRYSVVSYPHHCIVFLFLLRSETQQEGESHRKCSLT